jgi:hypothetical protein
MKRDNPWQAAFARINNKTDPREQRLCGRAFLPSECVNTWVLLPSNAPPRNHWGMGASVSCTRTHYWLLHFDSVTGSAFVLVPINILRFSTVGR